jgi:hypothetical protein
MMKNILLICGSVNQTRIMHKISQHLGEYNCFFSPFYADGLLGRLSQAGALDFSILGGQHRLSTDTYLSQNNLKVDFRGMDREYDLVITGTDTLMQRNIQDNRVILVQEGMTTPENLTYYLVKYLKLPRFIADTSTTGLSNAYDYFCVASPGYRDLFIRKGVRRNKIIVTGIPNFDDMASFRKNNFPFRNFVLVATSNARETFKYHNRVKLIKRALEIAGGRLVIFRLHPNENFSRAVQEIKEHAPGAFIYTKGNTEEMIANCSVLITQYSSVTFVGLALGKEVHTELDLDELKSLLPLQNGGTSAMKIASICRQVVHTPLHELKAAPINLQLLPD